MTAWQTTVKNEGTEILYGQDYFYEELLGLKFRISPFSFFQTNSLGAEVLYQTAREYIGDSLDENRRRRYMICTAEPEQSHRFCRLRQNM